MNNTKQKLKVPELVDKAEILLQERGYKKSLMYYRRYWNRFISFCEKKNYLYFTEDIGNEFLEEQKLTPTHYHTLPEGSTVKMIVRSIRIFGDYQLHGTVLRVTKHCNVTHDYGNFTDAYNAFEKYCIERNLSAQTLRTYGRYIRTFITFLIDNNVNSSKTLCSNHITAFALTLAGLSNANIRGHLGGIRFFLKVLYLYKYTDVDLRQFVPVVKGIKNAKIPSVWSKDNLNKLISVIDRGSPKGKRDYAILILISHLGLRVSDVRNLKLCNLNWSDSVISIVMQKTNQVLTLPITEVVGEALIDYLKHGRPKTPFDNVFLTHNAPFAPFADNNNLYNIIQKYIRAANIEVPKGKKHGVHSLRHSLASVLLEQNISLPVISDILGHINSDSTNYYLKIDINKLRDCALSMEEVLKND